MVKKPGRMYRDIRGQSYTRKEYMGGVPSVRIAQFTAGTYKKYSYRLSLNAVEACQIRDSALEAARIAVVKQMSAKAGQEYFMQIKCYPHHVLREHKTATGAGADRVSSGMRAAFGKAVGYAVRVKIGQCVMCVETNAEYVETAKKALKRASMKFPTPCRIVIESLAQ
jgi:large subunit ribosomal protein L10e